MVTSLNLSPFMLIVALIIFYLILGCFLDGFSMIVMTLPIVGVLLFLIGIVLAYLGVDQLRRVGAEGFTVNILGAGLLRKKWMLLAAYQLSGCRSSCAASTSPAR